MMIDLDELKRLAGLVTPGEWSPDDNDDRDCAQVIVSDRFGFEIGDVFAGERSGECEANAALICRLRNALHAIIAALETAALVRSVPHAVPAAKLDEVAASAVDWDGSDIPENEPAKWETEAGVIRDMVAEIRAYRAINAALPKETDNG